MPDSVGGGGFPRNINIGHEHLNLIDGLTYQYQGGVPTDVLNWKVIGGATAVDPSMVGWGPQHAGSMWFNSNERAYKFWDGVRIQTLRARPNELDAYRSDFLIEEEFVSGSIFSNTVGSWGWGLSGGTFAYVNSSEPNIGQASLTTGSAPGNSSSIFTVSSVNSLFTSIPHQCIWIMKLNQNDANTLVQFGISSQPTSFPPLAGAFFEKDFANTTWQIVTATGSRNAQSTSFPCDTNFHTFKYIFKGGVYSFFIDNINVGESTQNLPIDTSRGFAQVQTNAAASKVITVDYFQYYTNALTRL
jgi:hypothetical protein